MLLTSPRTGYDAVARRRTRRALSRLRPVLLPVAVVVAAFLLAGGRAPAAEPAWAPPPVVPPDGRVLVAVSPAEPAVLELARPGSLVDVYAAATAGWSQEPAGPAAVLLVSGALVVGVPPRAGGVGPLAPALPGSGGAGSLTLAVTDAQALALAGAGTTASGGGVLSLAVRGPAPGRAGPAAEQGGDQGRDGG